MQGMGFSLKKYMDFQKNETQIKQTGKPTDLHIMQKIIKDKQTKQRIKL